MTTIYWIIMGVILVGALLASRFINLYRRVKAGLERLRNADFDDA